MKQVRKIKNYDLDFFYNNEIALYIYKEFDTKFIQTIVPSQNKNNFMNSSVLEAFNFALDYARRDPHDIQNELHDMIEKDKGKNTISIFSLEYKVRLINDDIIFDERQLPINNNWVIRPLNNCYGIEMRLFNSCNKSMEEQNE